MLPSSSVHVVASFLVAVLGARGDRAPDAPGGAVLRAAVVEDAAAVLRAGGCPCLNASLCQPIARKGKEQVYAFHIGSISYCPGCPAGFTPRTTWRQYDWSQITTIGYQNWHSPAGSSWPSDIMDPELLCHAHAMNVRVTLMPPPTVWGTPEDWKSETFVSNASTRSTQLLPLLDR